MKLVTFFYAGGTISVELTPSNAEEILNNLGLGHKHLNIVDQDGNKVRIVVAHIIAVRVAA